MRGLRVTVNPATSDFLHAFETKMPKSLHVLILRQHVRVQVGQHIIHLVHVVGVGMQELRMPRQREIRREREREKERERERRREKRRERERDRRRERTRERRRGREREREREREEKTKVERAFMRTL